MKKIYRIFIRHEMEAQPTWFKMNSEKEHEELIASMHDAMGKASPSLLRLTDIDGHCWIFRADKIYSICVYPPEPEKSE